MGDMEFTHPYPFSFPFQLPLLPIIFLTHPSPPHPPFNPPLPSLHPSPYPLSFLHPPLPIILSPPSPTHYPFPFNPPLPFLLLSPTPSPLPIILFLLTHYYLSPFAHPYLGPDSSCYFSCSAKLYHLTCAQTAMSNAVVPPEAPARIMLTAITAGMP